MNNFRTVDKIFLQAKKIITFVIFIFLIFSVLYFLYWLIVSLQVQLPEFITLIFMGLINIFADSLADTPVYKNFSMLMPLVVSLFFIVLTYIFNCILCYIESSHKRFLKYVQDYKTNLETTINKQLHRNFIDELAKTKYFITMMKIEVRPLKSYLHDPMSDEEAQTLSEKILSSVFKLMALSYIEDKSLDGNCACFVCSDMRLASEFYTNLVQKAVALINKNIQEKISINFYCAVDVYDTDAEKNYKIEELKNLMNLKIKNKILVAPRFKVYYQEMYPGYFQFKLLGEYNFSKNAYRSNYINIYTLHRSN